MIVMVLDGIFQTYSLEKSKYKSIKSQYIFLLRYRKLLNNNPKFLNFV